MAVGEDSVRALMAVLQAAGWTSLHFFHDHTITLSQETQILTELSSRGVQASAYDLSTMTTDISGQADRDTHTVNCSSLVEEVVSGVLMGSADLNVVIVSTLALTISIFHNVRLYGERSSSEWRTTHGSEWLVWLQSGDAPAFTSAVAHHFDHLAVLLSASDEHLELRTMVRSGDDVELSAVTSLTSLPDHRLTRHRIFPNLHHGLGGRTLRIVTKPWEKYVIETKSRHNATFSGVCIDILKELSIRLNFSFSIVGHSGDWNSLLDELTSKRRDVVAVPMVVSASRLRKCDATSPMVYDDFTLIFRRPSDRPRGSALLSDPFQPAVFLALVISFFVVLLVLSALELSAHLSQTSAGRPAVHAGGDCNGGDMQQTIGRTVEREGGGWNSGYIQKTSGCNQGQEGGGCNTDHLQVVGARPVGQTKSGWNTGHLQKTAGRTVGQVGDDWNSVHLRKSMGHTVEQAAGGCKRGKLQTTAGRSAALPGGVWNIRDVQTTSGHFAEQAGGGWKSEKLQTSAGRSSVQTGGAWNSGHFQRQQRLLAAFASIVHPMEVLVAGILCKPLTYHFKSRAAGVLVWSWLMLSLVMAAAYSSQLMSSLTTTDQSLPFTSIEGLVRHGGGYTWGMLPGSAEAVFLQETRKPIVRKFYQRMQQFAEQNPTVLDPSLAVHERKCLSENYVYFGYRTTAGSWRQLDCSIVTSPQRVFQVSMAFHLQKGSPYTPLFSAEILRMYERGLIAHLERHWWRANTSHSCDQNDVKGLHVITWYDVNAVFYLACAGTGLGVVVLVAEIMHSRSSCPM